MSFPSGAAYWPGLYTLSTRMPGDSFLNTLTGDAVSLSGSDPAPYARAVLSALGSPSTPLNPSVAGFWDGAEVRPTAASMGMGGGAPSFWSDPVGYLKSKAAGYGVSLAVILVAILLLALGVWALLKD